jgi:hypothetical protein
MAQKLNITSNHGVRDTVAFPSHDLRDNWRRAMSLGRFPMMTWCVAQ